MRGLLLFAVLSGPASFAQSPPPESLGSPPATAKAPAKATVRSRKPVTKPIEIMKCKPASSQEEAKAREAAEALNFSDHEVLSRLIFSETLATGYFANRCDAPGAEVLMEAIGWTIINRVDKYSPKRDDPKPDAIFHVVFQRRQFSTSFSAKNENPFARSFLCPFEAQKYLDGVSSPEDGYSLYVEAKEVAARILDQYQRKGINVRFSRVSNMYYPYSEFAGQVRPSWAKDPDPMKNKGFVKLIEGEKPCAEFYKK